LSWLSWNTVRRRRKRKLIIFWGMPFSWVCYWTFYGHPLQQTLLGTSVVWLRTNQKSRNCEWVSNRYRLTINMCIYIIV
jgi:hypothetical protein